MCRDVYHVRSHFGDGGVIEAHVGNTSSDGAERAQNQEKEGQHNERKERWPDTEEGGGDKLEDIVRTFYMRCLFG